MYSDNIIGLFFSLNNGTVVAIYIANTQGTVDVIYVWRIKGHGVCFVLTNGYFSIRRYIELNLPLIVKIYCVFGYLFF